MWIFNNKSIIIELEKLSFKVWDEVNWNIMFDFDDEYIKARNIKVSLIREYHWNSNNKNKYTYLEEITLKNEWEYNKEEIPFNFIIPKDSFWSNISLDFSKLIDKLPSVIKKIINTIWTIIKFNNKYTFEVVARIDIPWWIDIKSSKSINIDK